jgi:hypothetical protein
VQLNERLAEPGLQSSNSLRPHRQRSDRDHGQYCEYSDYGQLALDARQLGFIQVVAVTGHIAIAAKSVSPLKHGRIGNPQSQRTSLDEQALRYFEKNATASVQELHDALTVRNPSLTKMEVADLVWRLAEQDKVALEDVSPAAKSLMEYLRFWERNLWLYVSLAVSFATLLVIYLMPSAFPFVILRWVLGSVFVLFIPGYVTVEALFPKGRELDSIERFALSVGLSLALVPLVGLLLNYTPWGIRLTPIVISLTVLTVGLALVGLARQYRLSAERSEA